MSKKINWSLINAQTIETVNSYIYATSGTMKECLATAKKAVELAESDKAQVILERDLCREELVSGGMLLADAIAESVRKFADRLAQASSALADAESALETLQEKKRNALNKGLTVVPDSVYDAYKASARKVDVTAYVTATVEMLTAFGLTATEVQTEKLADTLSRWAGGMKRASGKAFEAGHRKTEQVKRTFKASMLDALVEYLIWEAKSFRYNEDKTALVLYTGEDKKAE